MKKRISEYKGSILKTCENPVCKKGLDNSPRNFWGYTNDRYCSQECRKEAKKIRLSNE